MEIIKATLKQSLPKIPQGTYNATLFEEEGLAYLHIKGKKHLVCADQVEIHRVEDQEQSRFDNWYESRKRDLKCTKYYNPLKWRP